MQGGREVRAFACLYVPNAPHSRSVAIKKSPPREFPFSRLTHRHGEGKEGNLQENLRRRPNGENSAFWPPYPARNLGLRSFLFSACGRRGDDKGGGKVEDRGWFCTFFLLRPKQPTFLWPRGGRFSSSSHNILFPLARLPPTPTE